MHLIKNICICLLFSHLSSCDPVSTIKYEIVNNTSGAIQAKYTLAFDPSGDTSAKEVIIPANTGQVIGVYKPLGFATQFDQRYDAVFLHALTIRQGNKVTRQNFKDKECWRFESKDPSSATYTLIIDSSMLYNE